MACKRVLATIVKRLSMQDSSRLVVIGGLVPGLLLPRSEPDSKHYGSPHIGTTDVDICVQLSIGLVEDTLYQTLEDALTQSGFSNLDRRDGRGVSLWQFSKQVDGVIVKVELLAPLSEFVNQDGVPETVRLGTNSKNRPGDNIAALAIRGADLVHIDPRKILLEVELLDNGGIAKVNVHVANILPFIVLKSLALRGREKDKDAYDLVWLLANWPGGPLAAANEARTSPVAARPEVSQAIEILSDAFQTEKHEGCVRYARFFDVGGRDHDQAAQLARFAHGTVTHFLLSWSSAS